MFCENCGSKIPDGAAFCENCGSKIKSKNASNEAASIRKDKNMITALIISFILTGLGIAYAGNKKKGLILFIVGIVFSILGIAIPVCSIVAILIWAYGLYETYNQVMIANGEANPNLIEDIKGFPTNKKIGAIIVIAIIGLIVIGSVVGALTPKHDTTDDDNLDNDYDTDTDLDDSSSGSGSSSSSSSSSSDGYDTHSHYEDEYGSADLEGRVNDDGSVDAHQTGHTDYGDYEIDSHMDSDGNIHGTVDVGGKTYHVSS